MLEALKKSSPDVVAVVTGIQIGEETKGAAVEWLTRELGATTTIRNGGSQAGHHIVTADGREQMFSHFSAATFEGAESYLRHMAISPVLLFQEALELEGKGVSDPFSLITIDGNNISVTPFHGAISRLKEILRDDRKGTIGIGIGDAVKDALQGHVHVRARDFLGSTDELLLKVEAIRQRKISQAIDLIVALGVEELPEDAMAEMHNLYNRDLVLTTVQSFQYLADLLNISEDEYLQELLAIPGNIVTEPSHGALLHPFAFAPHTTQVDPTSKELIQELKENGSKKVVRIGVGRCYMTRHGAGPLVSFDRQMSDSIHETHNAANPWANEWLGEFRIGHYDLIATQYALEIGGGTNAFDGLMISYMDKIANQDRWGVVEAYTFAGVASDLANFFELEGEYITGIKVHPDTRDEAHAQYQLRLTELLKQCKPVVSYLYPTEEFSLEEVFIEYVEKNTGIPVIAVSRGPKAEDREKRPAWDTVFGIESKEVESASLGISRPLGVDFFYAGLQSSETLPQIAENSVLLREAALRRELFDMLQSVFQKVPDVTMNFSTALERGLLSETERDTLYNNLAEFITSDESYSRLVLYLPAQLLPEVQSGREQSPAVAHFAKVLADAWLRLLYVSEPRATFVDGDALPPGQESPITVRKAAHLLPDYFQQGIISFEDIVLFVENNDESELLSSLAEGIMIARDLGLFSEMQWSQLESILGENLRILDDSLKSSEVKTGFDFPSELSKLETLYGPDSRYVRTISRERVAWEKQVALEEIFDTQAQLNVEQMVSGALSVQDVLAGHPVVGLKSLLLFTTKVAQTNLPEAQVIALRNKYLLLERWKSGDAAQQDVILTMLNHWSRLSIVDTEYVDLFGVDLPDLSQPFPVDLEKRQTSDFSYALEVVKTIKNHALLSKYLYPVFVEVGSRVKGQAGITTDYDGGIVFKPETPWELRTQLLRILRQETPELSRVEKPIEFWLSKKDGVFGFKQAPAELKNVATPDKIHFLLNGVWVYESDEFSQICNDLVGRYLDLSRFGEQKDPIRSHLIRQLELDMLAYRFMHKGFKRFYPSNKPQETEHGDLIDSKSDFWDPGYRRIATQLFLSRVFLPDCS